VLLGPACCACVNAGWRGGQGRQGFWSLPHGVEGLSCRGDAGELSRRLHQHREGSELYEKAGEAREENILGWTMTSTESGREGSREVTQGGSSA
jgi:hypothetical protein